MKKLSAFEKIIVQQISAEARLYHRTVIKPKRKRIPASTAKAITAQRLKAYAALVDLATEGTIMGIELRK